ncbi:hypothetical protein KY311_00210 [Candidatus Woesearchaeota archaeon]|nr:hypothetical protein [Candidatus Woesearchaeota archaeon]
MNIKEKLLSIAIAIVFVLFVGFAIEAFYPTPEWDDYCGQSDRYYAEPMIIDKSYNCTRNITLDIECEGFVKTIAYDDKNCPVYECDLCSIEYEDAQEVYNRILFIITSIVGLAVLLVSVYLKLESVSTGLMAGAVLTIIYGVIRYWMDMQNNWRVIVLGVILAVLIWVGYKKLKK